MYEVPPATKTKQLQSLDVDSKPSSGGDTVTPSVSNRNQARFPRRQNAGVMSTPKDFEGATPKIGGILALRSENMTHKVNYDVFARSLGSTS